MKKLNVLHLLASNKYSGAENVACTIIKYTKNVNSFYCSPPGEIENTLKEQNIKYIEINGLSVSRLKEIVIKYNIDIIHAHDFQASFFASFLYIDVDVISHIHCNYKLLKFRKLVSFVYSRIQHKFSKIFVVSKEILEDASFGKKIKPKTLVLNNVVDEDKIIKLSKSFETNKYDLIFVGRLIELKQPLFFISLVSELKKEKNNIKACIVGDGVLYKDCLDAINKNDLSANIELMGFKSNPFPYIKNSKVTVMPSKFEGLPMSAVESLILDVPVVNSGVGGLKSMFMNYEEYICNDMKEYKDIILDILNNKTSALDCKNIRKEFTDIKGYSKKIEEIYKEVSSK